ncbi:MAG: ECF transporter S component [Clostridiales bacterium]|jgi:uncharacterized membrane protein|nr:ECF transporter S component [Clostridiales bacterium]
MNSEPIRRDTARPNVKKLAGLALFAAIVVVLQIIGTFVKLGPFSISLVLIPIVVGAAVYGTGAGAFLGFVFGVVVMIADPTAHFLLTLKPFSTLLVVLVKGTAAGAVSALVFKALERKNTYLGVVVAAVVCPIVNTGLFCTAMFFLFKDVLAQWVGGKITFIAVVMLVLANFLFELATNVIFSPVIMRIIRAGKKV